MTLSGVVLALSWLGSDGIQTGGKSKFVLDRMNTAGAIGFLFLTNIAEFHKLSDT